jgi:hypothetical protein
MEPLVGLHNKDRFLPLSANIMQQQISKIVGSFIVHLPGANVL